MVADIGELYTAVSRKLRHIVSRDVNAPAAVIDDACQVAWLRLVLHAGASSTTPRCPG